MIDLEKEFRTLRLLAKALIIIGGGLSVGGLGMMLLVHFGTAPAKPKRPAYVAPQEEVAEKGTPESPVPSQPPEPVEPDRKDYKEKMSSSSIGLVLPTAILGLLFLILGV